MASVLDKVKNRLDPIKFLVGLIETTAPEMMKKIEGKIFFEAEEEGLLITVEIKNLEEPKKEEKKEEPKTDPLALIQKLLEAFNTSALKNGQLDIETETEGQTTTLYIHFSSSPKVEVAGQNPELKEDLDNIQKKEEA